jgi:hypothetical protein
VVKENCNRRSDIRKRNRKPCIITDTAKEIVKKRGEGRVLVSVFIQDPAVKRKQFEILDFFTNGASRAS